MPDLAVDVLAGVFRALDEAGVKWCWYKGYEHWPMGVGGDVDLAVSPSQLEASIEAISALARRTFARAFVACSHADVTACHLFFDGLPAVEIDLNAARWYWAGAPFLDAGAVVASRRRSGDVWVPAPAHEFLLLLLLYGMGPKVAAPRRLRALERARGLALREPEACHLMLLDAMGQRSAEDVWKALERGDWPVLLRAARRTHLRAVWRAFMGGEAMQVVRRAAWVFVGRPLSVRNCGLWKGRGRSIRPVRASGSGQTGWEDGWLHGVLRQHASSWIETRRRGLP